MVASSSSGSSGRSRGGDGGGGSHQAVKKGPWTAAEDAILMEYVRKHGEGNWNAVQRNSGLQRCGKSCRLRWANHLRPNLKKGAFSPEEERLIIELHAKLGNKWARMASQLPGRTDNEIKNYWNTRVKRLQRAGLPIYPNDVVHSRSMDHPLQQNQRQYPNSSPSANSYPTSKFNPPLSLFDPIINFSAMANPFQPSSSSSFVFNGNSSITNFASPISQFSSSSSPSSFFNQGFQSELLTPYPIQFKPSNYTMGGTSLINSLELPSIQPPAVVVATTDSSGNNSGGGGGDFMMGTPSGGGSGGDCGGGGYSVETKEGANSGLLEALLEESKALANAEKLKREIEVGAEEDAAFPVEDSSSAQSTLGVKEEDPIEEMNPMDDDLSSLLNNFPLTVPVPDWYNTSTTTTSNGESSNMNKDGDSGGLENSPDGSCSPAETVATANPKFALGSSCCNWKNMPGIC